MLSYSHQFSLRTSVASPLRCGWRGAAGLLRLGLLFFYSKVLDVYLPWMQEIGRPRVHKRLPVVLSQIEVARVLALIDAYYRLLARLLYGTGMRIKEGFQLRVKDVEFDRRAIIVARARAAFDCLASLCDSFLQRLGCCVVCRLPSRLWRPRPVLDQRGHALECPKRFKTHRRQTVEQLVRDALHKSTHLRAQALNG